MRFSKLLFAVMGATVLLGALVGSGSARNFETSSQTTTGLWRRMDSFLNGGVLWECEVRLSGSFHTRTWTKTVNSLIGYITEGTVLRCRRGGATINQASFPWHRQYRIFTGTLPNITGTSETVTGDEWRIREAFFGATCTIARESSSIILTYAVSSGTVVERNISGENSCSGISITFSGLESNETNETGARITVRLI